MIGITLIGASGSGKSTLQEGLQVFSSRYKVFPKITTRVQRIYETNDHDYHFIDDKKFDELIATNEFVHIKYSDFDVSRYGVKRTDLLKYLEEGLVPIFTSHSLEEAHSLTHCLNTIGVFNFCVYIFAKEERRKAYLFDQKENKKYFSRYYIDMAFKIQDFEKRYQDCQYFIYNNGSKVDLLMHCNIIDKFLNERINKKIIPNLEIPKEVELEINALVNTVDNG